MRDSGNVSGIRDLIATRPGRAIRQNLSTDAGLGKKTTFGMAMADKFGMRPDSRETSGNAGYRFPGPSRTPDTPRTVRDDRRAETHFVGFILRGAHTGKLSCINQLSAIGSGNLKLGKPEEEEEQKGGGERMSKAKKNGGGVSPGQ